MKMLWVLALMIVAALAAYVYMTAFQISDFSFQLPLLSEAVYSGAVLILSFFILKVYCIVWRDLSKAKNVVNLYEALLLPLMVLVTPVLISYRSMRIDASSFARVTVMQWLFLVVLLILLSDLLGFFRNGIKKYIVDPYGSGLEHFAIQIPMQSRVDIWLVDVGLNGSWLVLLLTNIFHKH